MFAHKRHQLIVLHLCYFGKQTVLCSVVLLQHLDASYLNFLTERNSMRHTMHSFACLFQNIRKQSPFSSWKSEIEIV